MGAKGVEPTMDRRNGSHYGKSQPSSRKRRLLFGFLDQGIVSGTSLINFVAAAQFLPSDDLGYFSFSVATCVLTVSLIRAVCGESLIVRAVGRSNFRPTVARDSRSMLGVAAILSLLASVLCVGAGVVGPALSWPLIASAVACPGLVLQDSLRFVFISMQRTKSLLLNDAGTLVLGTAAIAISGFLTRDVFVMVAAWGLASLSVTVGTLVFNAMAPSLRGVLPWFRLTWRTSSAFFTESALGAMVGYLIIVMLTIFVDPSEVAAYRATVVVFGVSSLVLNFLRTQVLRELRVDMIDSVNGVLRISMRLLVPVIVTIVGMLGALLVMPEWMGNALMRDTWILVGALIIPGAISRLFAGFSTIPTITLRVQGVTWKATVIKICVLSSSLIIGPAAALYAGAAGALYADALAYGLTSILLFALSIRRAKLMSS